MKNIKVYPVISSRSGEAVRNQYVIKCESIIAFQSYDSLIATYDWSTDVLTLGRHWDYSVTTSKYLHQFLQNHFPRYRELPKGKSLRDTLTKAINSGLIQYDEDMR